MGHCYAGIICSLRVYEIASGGVEVLLSHFSRAEVARTAGSPTLHSRRNETPSTPHHAHHRLDFHENKLRRKWTVHFPWQGNRAKKTGWDVSLGSAPGRKSSAGLRDPLGFIALVGCCSDRLKEFRPWEDHLSVFILSTIDKCTEVSGKIRESVSVFLVVCETLTPAKATWDEKHEMEIVFTSGQIFHLHQTRQA